MAGWNKIRPKSVSLSDRTFIIGDAELMGYVGIGTYDTLKKKLLDKGLLPSSVMGKVKYYRRSVVDKFIEDNSDVNFEPKQRKRYTRKEAAL